MYRVKTIFSLSILLIAASLIGCTNTPASISNSSSSSSSSSAPYVAPSVNSNPWSFGVMGDTQWLFADDGYNPGSVSVGIVNFINQEFISKNVKLVVEVGDLADNLASDYLLNNDSTTNHLMTNYPANEDVRAVYAQALYNAGIAFYPLRGDHDDYSNVAVEFTRIYPQTANGGNNNTPADVLANTGNLTDASVTPVAKTGGTFNVGSSFNSPFANLNGLSYSFDYNNVRFVLIDQFTRLDGTAPGVIDDQLSWINTSLSGRPAGTHAFVFAHKGIVTENHLDNLFGSDPSQDTTGQNNFISSLSNNGVRYFIGGHDHIHQRSIVKSPDSLSQVWEFTEASCSSKFYVPNNTNSRETCVSQETNTIGYYIYTVNGPLLNVDFYSENPQPILINGEWLITNMNGVTSGFTKKESYGYSLNGKEFLVPEGSNYTVVLDTFSNTTAAILEGVNGSMMKDGQGRSLTKAVDTGWIAKNGTAYSDILKIWGMSDIGTTQSDKYVLSLSYSAAGLTASQLTNGRFGIASLNGSTWSNAVDLNHTSGTKTFVNGAYSSAYNNIGTYGINTNNSTVWAVIDYNGYFVVTIY